MKAGHFSAKIPGQLSAEIDRLGTTRVGVAELMAMSVYVGGGPALVYGADALRAFDQFAAH